VAEQSQNPRAPRRRTSAELARSVQSGRRFGEALRTLGFRAENADGADRDLAHELARALVRRCDTRHDGWRSLRQALQQAGAEAPWTRAERQAFGPTAERILADCASPGHTTLVRTQHAAAQELARALAPHIDPDTVLPRMLKDDAPDAVSDEAWERALVAAVNARTHTRAAELIADSLATEPLDPTESGEPSGA
jgi:hypothetical protein